MESFEFLFTLFMAYILSLSRCRGGVGTEREKRPARSLLNFVIRIEKLAGDIHTSVEVE